MEQIATQFGVSQQQISKPAKTASKKHRQALSLGPPFDAALVQVMIAEALRGPKGRVAQIEVDDRTVSKLVATLNARRAAFASAQADQDRARRRDRAIVLIGELRALLPPIVKDGEQWTEFFGRNTSRAVAALSGALCSDLPERALPAVDLVTSGEGWRWVCPSLYSDLKDLLGANAALRFVHAVLPTVSGQSPSLPTIKAYLKQKQAG